MKQETIIHILAGVLGVLFHCLIAYKGLKEKADAANVIFDLKTYLKQDWLSISLSFLSIGIWLIALPEIAILYPKLLDFVRLTFIGMGYCGSSLIQFWLGKAKDKLTAIIDVQTNAFKGTQKSKIDTPLKEVIKN